MPDILVVFRNGAVGGEETGFADIDQSPSGPVRGIHGVIVQGLVLAYHVGIEVRQCLEPVFADQLVAQAVQMLAAAQREHFPQVKLCAQVFGLVFSLISCMFLSY